MLDIHYVRDHIDEIRQNIKNRNVELDLDLLLELDGQRRELQKAVEANRQKRNEVAEAMKSATADQRPALIEEGKSLKTSLAEIEPMFVKVDQAFQEMMMKLPNITHPDAPIGNTDADNKVIDTVGDVKKPGFKKLSHVELAAKHDLIDFERAAKVTGAKFYFLKGKLAMLEQALINWTLREVVSENYFAMSTPDLARDEVLVGVGFNPRGPEAQIYSIENSDLSLIGTAEITIGGYHKDEVLEEASLPMRYAGISHCYRTEAGAYGRESYGLYRVHQFSKVEMFIFCAPEQSDALHLEIRRIEERIFTLLGIPYQVVDICTGDLGGPAYRKFDLEAWMWGREEGKGGYGEVTSTSNCTDYQARRLNIRVRRKNGTIEYAHTLNGTAISCARALIAIMENYQQEDGSILIPDVLRPYCGFDKIG